MSGSMTISRGSTHRRPRRTVRPTLEGLEDRKLLYATLGGSWTYGSRITYSFVPDGTNVGGISSNLYATLDTVAPTASWQAAIQKAAVIWSSYANINLALVSDDGSALSASGNQQGDTRFGDIRIAMIPQSGPLAVSFLPPPYNGGTVAGDIVFNSNIAWQVNSHYDLETVALHEFGHALGLGHSTISSAVLYAYYNNIKQSLTTDDASGIQSIYGAYPADPINDGSFNTAQDITGLIDGNLQIAIPGQSLAGTSDADYFIVTVPSGTTGTMTVSMQTSNLSSGSPNLVVYRGNRTGIGATSLPNSFGATATFTVNGVSAGEVYYIRARPASALGSYGAYGLLVNFGSGTQAPIPPPNTVVPTQPDQGGGSIGMVTAPRGSRGRGGAVGGAGHGLIQVGDLFGYGEVLTGGIPGLDRIDPNGDSIPVAPGGPSVGDVMSANRIDQALALGQIALAPPVDPAGIWWDDLFAPRDKDNQA